MTTLSPRFAPALALLLAVSALPVLRQARAFTPSSCPAAKERASAVLPGSVTLRAETAVDAEPWRLYGRPARDLTDVSFPEPPEPRRLAVDGIALPLHWEESDALGIARVRGHLYLLDGTPVERPFAAGLARAWRQLVDGRPPLVRIMAYAEGPSAGRTEIGRAVEERLARDWRTQRDRAGSATQGSEGCGS